MGKFNEEGQQISRRSFLKAASGCSGVYLFSPVIQASEKKSEILRFGLIADLHQDIIHDAERRITDFVSSMNSEKVDFVCQLGDFCIPKPSNSKFLEAWKKFDGPRYDVLGNHDMDGGYKPVDTMKFWGMEKPYYSFDSKGVHVMVLDGNEPGGKSKGYNRYIGAKQREWIKQDLDKTSLPTIVFIHQALDDLPRAGVENADEVRALFEDAKRSEGGSKVVACFCGHHHVDSATKINGIHYMRVNSASYVWLGAKHKGISYSKEVHAKHKNLINTVPFKDPIWALIEIDTTKGKIVVKGRETKWVGDDPWERGATKEKYNPNYYTTEIKDRAMDL